MQRAGPGAPHAGLRPQGQRRGGSGGSAAPPRREKRLGAARVRSGESRARGASALLGRFRRRESPRPEAFGNLRPSFGYLRPHFGSLHPSFGNLRPRFGYLRPPFVKFRHHFGNFRRSVGNGRRRARPSGLRGEDRPAFRNKPTVSGPEGGEQGRADGAGRQGSGYGSPPSPSRLRREGEVRAPRGSRQMSRELATEEEHIPVFQLIALYKR
ncbi:uncharacterized protein LOC114068409 [Empidonax traillii]|uniref:uncharacterized protein LOC114068409 n=1 Tax=Empidonax traillii TaxID=164674 RepID=UPI000FFD170A|nr:uncharacterized protein LOC114068409 [Empidonax traillii]